MCVIVKTTVFTYFKFSISIKYHLHNYLVVTLCCPPGVYNYTYMWPLSITVCGTPDYAGCDHL